MNFHKSFEKYSMLKSQQTLKNNLKPLYNYFERQIKGWQWTITIAEGAMYINLW